MADARNDLTDDQKSKANLRTSEIKRALIDAGVKPEAIEQVTAAKKFESIKDWLAVSGKDRGLDAMVLVPNLKGPERIM